MSENKTDNSPSPILKQSKVNRVWRLVRRNKRFSALSFWQALSNLIFQLLRTNLVLIDFTSVEGRQAWIFIASFPFRGGSIPFFGRVLGKQDIDEMKYPSQNEFILDCFRQLIKFCPSNLSS